MHGLGLYHVLKGDRLISSPFSSPILLNVEVVEEGSGCDWAVKKHNLSVQDIQPAAQVSCMASKSPRGDESMPISHVEAALRHFQEAQAFFKRSKSPRGEAITVLRIACLARLADYYSSRTTRSPDFRQLPRQLHSARQPLRTCGDILSEQVVHVHIILFPTRDITGVLNAARIDEIQPHIGDYAESRKNQAFVLCLASFAMQIGHYSRSHGDFNHAIYCYQISLSIISSTSVFLTVKIRLLLTLACLYASRGDAHTAVNWSSLALKSAPRLLERLWMTSEGDPNGNSQLVGMRILHLQMNPGSGGVSIGGQGLLLSTSSQNHSRNVAYNYFLKEVVSSSISIDLQFAELFRIGEASRRSQTTYAQYFQTISLFDVSESSKEWLAYQRRRLEYLDALTNFKLSLEKLKTSAALATAKKFLSYEPLDLSQNAHMIEMATRCSYLETAQDLLATVKDEDLIPLEAVSMILPTDNLGPFPSYDRQRIFQSLELILSCAIKSSQWIRARRLMNSLEKFSPGYFTSDLTQEGLWPGQRKLFAALIYANHKCSDIAWVFVIKTLAEITRARARVKLTKRMDFDNMAKAGRAANMLVSLALELEKMPEGAGKPAASIDTGDRIIA